MGGLIRQGWDPEVQAFRAIFERARVKGIAPIHVRRPRHVLLTVDRSSQDALGIAVAQELRGRFACKFSVVDAREGAVSGELATGAASAVGGVVMPRSSGNSADQILAAVEQSGCDLVVLPCPYGQTLESLGANSVGPVIDALLSHCGVPILALRMPFDSVGVMFEQVQMLISTESGAAPLAAAWAGGLVVPRGTLRLVLLLEREVRHRIQGLLHSGTRDVSLDPEALAEAMVDDHVLLHRSLQKTASSGVFRYEFDLRLEDIATTVPLVGEHERPLLVLPMDRSYTPSHPAILDRIRVCPSPVLVVAE